MTMPRASETSRPAFTLPELVAAVLIAGILAAGVLPAMARFDDARRSAATHEVRRLIVHARERAIATGRPVGAAFDDDAESVRLLTLDDLGQPAALTTPLGDESAPLLLTPRFGAALDRVLIPRPGLAPPGPAATTLWFDHRGVPHHRSATGAHEGALEAPALIVLDHGDRLSVAAISGLVEGP